MTLRRNTKTSQQVVIRQELTSQHLRERGLDHNRLPGHACASPLVPFTTGANEGIAAAEWWIDVFR